MHLLACVLLTYLVHSSVLLGAAALACAALRARQLALQEALLRAALVGGLVTSTLQVGFALEPMAGRLHLPFPLVAEASPEPPALAGAAAIGATGLGIPAARLEARAARAPSAPERLAGAASGAVRATSAAGARVWRSATRGWRTVLAVGWAAAALVGLARLVVASARLRHLLRGRSRIAGDSLAAGASLVAETLGIHRPVRLSVVPRLAAPLATGLLRPEVCLPTRALVEMDGEEQLALCAHELAHVARRDPAWILLVRGVEALAPVQPLNTWARRRLQDLAECLSDDLAVSASARPLGLARSLVDVASWTIGEDTVPPVTAAGALDRRSRLGHRVERIMDTVRAPERPNRLFLPVAAVVVLASALVTPAVSGSSSPGGPKEPAASAPAPAAPHPPQPPARMVPADAPLAPEAPLPEAEPLPAPAPPPKSAPAPAAKPAPPAKPHPAPHAHARAGADELETLAQAIESRVQQHEGELSALQAQIEALARRITPNEAELERLGEELGRAGEDLAQAVLDGIGGEKSERAAAAGRRMAELETQLQALANELRVPADEIRALAEKSRLLAQKARPTEGELRRAREEMRRAHEEARREHEREESDRD